MKGLRIDTISNFDLSTITFEDIRWQVGTGINISTGQGYHKISRYRLGVETPLGDIEESIWYQLAEAIIKRVGEQQLLAWTVEWEHDHNYTKDTPAELRKRALRLHATRSFDNPKWVHYIPFNRKYRTEELEKAHLVTVITECCKRPGEVTQERIDMAYDGQIPCPHCGRWSPFSVWNNRIAERDPCLECDCHDPDLGCTMPSIDKCYACPVEDKKTFESEGADEEIHEPGSRGISDGGKSL